MSSFRNKFLRINRRLFSSAIISCEQAAVEQTPLKMVFPSGNHYSVETMKTIHVACLVDGHNRVR